MTRKSNSFTGHVNYTGAHSLFPQASDPESLQLFLLPPLTPADHYATLEVRIPADHLLFSSNLAVRARAVWGTEVYTDDSDIVGGVPFWNSENL